MKTQQDTTRHDTTRFCSETRIGSYEKQNSLSDSYIKHNFLGIKHHFLKYLKNRIPKES